MRYLLGVIALCLAFSGILGCGTGIAEGDETDDIGGNCTPNEFKCEGNDLFQCSDESNWAQVETCVDGCEQGEDGEDARCSGIEPGDAVRCGPDCSSGPSGDADFDLEQYGVTGVAENDKGYLVLGQGSLTYPSIWIANSGEGTVSRLDTLTGNEMGRYTVCKDPSRTAVDLKGDVWVACREDGGVAKITLVEANCVDQNGDGVISTSHDEDGDGLIRGDEMLPAGQDECIRFIVFPGGSKQRAAGVDFSNHAWIGAWNDDKLFRLAPEDGATVQEISIPVHPYGLVIDGDGIIWVSGRGGNQLVRVDPVTEDVQALNPSQGGLDDAFHPYGISLDGAGRVWVASCCSDNRVFRYTPTTQEWAVVTTHPRPRGLVGHFNGRVYVANDNSDQVAVINAETMKVMDYVHVGDNRFPIGIAVDSEEQVWAVNNYSASAVRIDPETNQTTGEFKVGKSPYTYSDMTGYVLYTFTSPLGYYFQTFCSDLGVPVQWTTLDAEMAIPSGTQIQVRVRSAPDTDALATTAWQAPFDPFPGETLPMDLVAIPGLDQACLQAEFLLTPNEDEASPMLKSISAQYQVLP